MVICVLRLLSGGIMLSKPVVQVLGGRCFGIMLGATGAAAMADSFASRLAVGLRD